MYPSNQAERRRYPRVQRQIPLKIKFDDFDLVGQTHDLSCVGAYCTINKYIPLFSKISIIMLLPLKTNNRKLTCNVRCQGVVVRAEENTQNSKQYKFAIYFNRLTKSDRAKLLQYVQQFL